MKIIHFIRKNEMPERENETKKIYWLPLGRFILIELPHMLNHNIQKTDFDVTDNLWYKIFIFNYQ